MSPIVRIPLGIFVMSIGFLMVKRTEVVHSWFGYNDFAERTFGQGGSYLFYKLIGILIVFIGIFIATNVASDILESLARVLTGNRKPS